MTETTLVLVCKRPAPGIGKQRLVAAFGTDMAQRVAVALLACALEDARDWRGPVIIAPANAEDVKWAKTVAAPIASTANVVPQTAGNLGQRLNALDQILRAQGMQQLVFIGSDAPGLGATDYEAVCTALQSADVVLIPAVDGGVVLMASRCGWPDLSNLPWSSDQLGDSLINCCRMAGLSVRAVGRGYDVDEIEDVMKLTHALQHDERPARRALFVLASTIMATMNIPHV